MTSYTRMNYFGQIEHQYIQLPRGDYEVITLDHKMYQVMEKELARKTTKLFGYRVTQRGTTFEVAQSIADALNQAEMKVCQIVEGSESPPM